MNEHKREIGIAMIILGAILTVLAALATAKKRSN